MAQYFLTEAQVFKIMFFRFVFFCEGIVRRSKETVRFTVGNTLGGLRDLQLSFS